MIEQTSTLGVASRGTAEPQRRGLSASVRYARAWRLAVEIEALVSTPEGKPLVDSRGGGRFVLALTRSLIDELEPLLDAR